MTNYYLITTTDTTLSYWKKQTGKDSYGNPLPNIWVTETVPINTVMNVIVYDGVKPFTAPVGQQLVNSTNIYNIGDLFVS